MIEMLGDLLRAIFGMISKGEITEARQSISEAYLTMLRKDASFFYNIPDEIITGELIEQHNYTDQHLEILAELLFAEAELNFAENKINESLPFYKKSLLLFEYVDKNYGTYLEERLEKIKRIKVKIGEFEKLKN